MTTLKRQAADDFLGDAWSQVEHHERVLVSAAAAIASIERLLDLARAEGAAAGRLRTSTSAWCSSLRARRVRSSPTPGSGCLS